MLPAYWVFLAAMTHLPKPIVPRAINNDRMLHFVAFGVLAFFYWKVRETFAAPTTRLSPVFAAAVLLAYAAVDECVQQFTGRTTDPLDWLADAAGVIAVLAALVTIRHVRNRRAASH